MRRDACKGCCPLIRIISFFLPLSDCLSLPFSVLQRLETYVGEGDLILYGYGLRGPAEPQRGHPAALLLLGRPEVPLREFLESERDDVLVRDDGGRLPEAKSAKFSRQFPT